MKSHGKSIEIQNGRIVTTKPVANLADDPNGIGKQTSKMARTKRKKLNNKSQNGGEYSVQASNLEEADPLSLDNNMEGEHSDQKILRTLLGPKNKMAADVTSPQQQCYQQQEDGESHRRVVGGFVDHIPPSYDQQQSYQTIGAQPVLLLQHGGQNGGTVILDVANAGNMATQELRINYFPTHFAT